MMPLFSGASLRWMEPLSHLLPFPRIWVAKGDDQPEDDVEDGGDQHALEVEPKKQERRECQVVCSCTFGERQCAHDIVKKPPKDRQSVREQRRLASPAVRGYEQGKYKRGRCCGGDEHRLNLSVKREDA